MHQDGCILLYLILKFCPAVFDHQNNPVVGSFKDRIITGNAFVCTLAPVYGKGGILFSVVYRIRHIRFLLIIPGINAADIMSFHIRLDPGSVIFKNMSDTIGFRIIRRKEDTCFRCSVFHRIIQKHHLFIFILIVFQKQSIKNIPIHLAGCKYPQIFRQSFHEFCRSTFSLPAFAKIVKAVMRLRFIPIGILKGQPHGFRMLLKAFQEPVGQTCGIFILKSLLCHAFQRIFQLFFLHAHINIERHHIKQSTNYQKCQHGIDDRYQPDLQQQLLILLPWLFYFFLFCFHTMYIYPFGP